MVRVRGAVEGGVVVRVGYLVVVADGRGPRDGGGDGGRADLLEAHGGGLGLLLVLLLERRRGAVVVLGRRRGRGAGGELLDHVAELVLADVVYLRLGVRRAGRLLRRRRRRCFADVPAVLVDAEVRVVSAAAAAIAAAAAVHHGGSAAVDLGGLAWAEERRWWGEGMGGREAHAMEFVSKLQRGFL